MSETSALRANAYRDARCGQVLPERVVQRLSGAETIRDVIAFPKTASGFDLLTGAPAPVGDLQLRELNIGIHKPKLPGY